MQKIDERTYYNKIPWDTDKLDRKGVAQTLTQVLSTITQPFVVSVDAPFGCGKSHFIANWHEQLKEEDYRTVLVNA